MSEKHVIDIFVQAKSAVDAGLNKAKSQLRSFETSMARTIGRVDREMAKERTMLLRAKDEATPIMSRAEAKAMGLSRLNPQVKVNASDGTAGVFSSISAKLSALTSKTHTVKINAAQQSLQTGAAVAAGPGMLSRGLMATTGFTGQMLAGAGVAYGLYDTVGTYMGFEKQMSAVGALSGASHELTNVQRAAGETMADFDKLTAKAKELGATTVFSASESAKAMEYMALAGWNTDQILGGSKGIIDLSAASGEELATVSDIVTDALTAFGMKAEESGRMANVLAATSSKSNTTVGMLGEAFKYAGASAGVLHYSIEDVSLAMGLMANSGLKASMAGTALDQMFNRMSTGQATEALAKLGVTAVNADGSMKPLRQTLKELRAATKNLSDSELGTAMYDAFGIQGGRGAKILMKALEEDFNKLADSIDTADASQIADKMAKERLDNLSGDLKLLASAWESVQIAFMEDKSGGFRTFVQSVSTELQKLNGLMKDGLDFGDLATIAGDAIEGLTKKFLKLDSVGSVLAGGVLAFGLSKVYKLTRNVINAFRDIPKLRGSMTGAPSTAGGASESVAKMMVTAGTVYVNGSVAGGMSGTGYMGGYGPVKSRPMVGSQFGSGGFTQMVLNAQNAKNFGNGGFQSMLASAGGANAATAKGAQRAMMETAANTRGLVKGTAATAALFGAINVATAEDKSAALAQSGGLMAGTLGGAAIGTLIAGPIGTAVGSAVGGMLGEFIGNKLYYGSQEDRSAGPKAGEDVSYNQESGVHMDAYGNTYRIGNEVKTGATYGGSGVTEPPPPEYQDRDTQLQKIAELEKLNADNLKEAEVALSKAQEEFGIHSQEAAEALDKVRDAQSHIVTTDDSGRVVNRKIAGDNDEMRIVNDFASQEEAEIWLKKNQEIRDYIKTMEDNRAEFERGRNLQRAMNDAAENGHENVVTGLASTVPTYTSPSLGNMNPDLEIPSDGLEPPDASAWEQFCGFVKGLFGDVSESSKQSASETAQAAEEAATLAQQSAETAGSAITGAHTSSASEVSARWGETGGYLSAIYGNAAKDGSAAAGQVGEDFSSNASKAKGAWEPLGGLFSRLWQKGQDIIAMAKDAIFGSEESGKPHANGGFVDGPLHALVGEAGPEVIIPLSPGRRGRGLDLWRKAGSLMGQDVPAAVNGSSVMGQDVPAFANGGFVGLPSSNVISPTQAYNEIDSWIEPEHFQVLDEDTEAPLASKVRGVTDSAISFGDIWRTAIAAPEYGEIGSMPVARAEQELIETIAPQVEEIGFADVPQAVQMVEAMNNPESLFGRMTDSGLDLSFDADDDSPFEGADMSSKPEVFSVSAQPSGGNSVGSISISLGGVSLNVDISGGEAGNPQSIVEAINANIEKITDKIASELSDKVQMIFENEPLTT